MGRASLATSPKMESSSRKLAAARNFRAVKLGILNENQLPAPALNLSFPALETHRVAFPFRSSLSACENSFKPKFSMYAPAAISSVNASSVACSDLVCRGDRELVSDVVPPHPTTRGTCVDVSTHLF